MKTLKNKYSIIGSHHKDVQKLENELQMQIKLCKLTNENKDFKSKIIELEKVLAYERRKKESHNKEMHSDTERAKEEALHELRNACPNQEISFLLPDHCSGHLEKINQVGTANGSLDKNPLTESKTEPIKTECTYKNSHERASKRKASSLIAYLTKENVEDEDDEGWFDYSHGKGTGTTSKSSPKTRRINENKIADKQLEKQENLLTDRVIQEVLDDWNTDEEGETAVKKNAEVRSLPLVKDVRLLEKRVSLRNTEMVKETRMTVKNGDESDEERKEEKRPKLCEQRKKEEKLCRTKNGNKNWEHLMSDDDDEDKSETNRESDAQNGNQFDVVITTTFNMRCPICNKLFSHGEIENHAAFCEQFDTNNAEDDPFLKKARKETKNSQK